MDLRRIRYFVAAAEQLHFGRAAERMNVVQPAISQQIKRLEEELDVELFDRIGNEVRLTEAGRQMLPECYRLLSQAKEVSRIARAANAGTRGRIRFGFVDNSICALLPPLIKMYRSRFPEVEINLAPLDRVGQLEELQERRLDIGLIPGPVPEGLIGEAFISAPLIAALPSDSPLASRPVLELEMLASEPFVLFPPAVRSRILEVVLAACASASFTPNVVQEAAQMHTLLAMVAGGLGVSLVPSWVGHDTGIIGVTFRPLAKPTPPYDLQFAWPEDSANPALEGFLDIARTISRTRHPVPHPAA